MCSRYYTYLLGHCDYEVDFICFIEEKQVKPYIFLNKSIFVLFILLLTNPYVFVYSGCTGVSCVSNLGLYHDGHKP